MADFDLIVRNGAIVDGTGAARRRADIGINGDRIIALGDLTKATAVEEVDASGHIVAPGFIDSHAHDDTALFSTELMGPKLRQGVTTVVTGNCGISLAPLVLDARPPAPLDLIGRQEDFRFASFADYVTELEASRPAANVALLVGHITLRLGAMDNLERAATPEELTHMQRGIDAAIDAGAIGFSTGLDYPNAVQAPTAEIISLAAVAGRRGGIYACHARGFGDEVEDAVEEALTIGREAKVPLVLSHHKVVGRANFGRTRDTLARIARARASQPVRIDVYPYNATSLTLFPSRCVDPEVSVMVTWSHPHPEAAGRLVSDLAAEWSCSLREAAERLVPAGAVYFELDEQDVRRLLTDSETMIGTDALPHDTHPHPRLWGAMPRLLGHYVRELGLLPLEEAVRRVTSLTADTFGLAGRGRIAADGYADLVIFNADTIIDRATFAQPRQGPEGIKAVFVNGRPAWRNGELVPTRSGNVLRRRQVS